MKIKYPTPKQIRDARLRAGLSLEAAAAQLNLRDGTAIQRWESGETKRISPLYLKALMDLPANPEGEARLLALQKPRRARRKG